jgi:hypothetical protein
MSAPVGVADKTKKRASGLRDRSNMTDNPDFDELTSKMYRESVGDVQIPDILYHYTSMEAAKSILETNKFRFTHGRFTNDLQEIREGLLIVWDILHKKADVESENDISTLLRSLAYCVVLTLVSKKEGEKIIEGAKERFQNWGKQIEIAEQWKKRDVYLACFSGEAAKDKLSMWYMYGDRTNGVALGFDAKILINEHEERIGRKVPHLWALKIVYDKGKYKEIVSAYADNLVKFVKAEKLKNGSTKHLQNGGSVKNDFFGSSYYYLVLIALMHKHDSFSDEHEWRLIFNYGREMGASFKEFHLKDGVLKPIAVFPSKAGYARMLSEVMVGAGNQNEGEWIQEWLSMMDSKATITKSAIPFRST